MDSLANDDLNRLSVGSLRQYVAYVQRCMTRCPFKRYEDEERSQVSVEQNEIVLEITMSRQ